MANFSEDIQCAGSDTRPPMLDRTDFASWHQQIRIYCRGKENGVNILKSIDKGPYRMGTVRAILAESTEEAPQFGPERPKLYSDLTSKEKDRYNADIRATNILLQGLPKDIYTLINHYIDAKDIWDNVKMLLEGSEMTKEEGRESQLYDEFEHFRQHKGESIHDYYVRFVTAVKLNRGLRDSNYDQLYAYLKQHETHPKENKMMLERFSQPTVDPLTLLSNISNPQHYSPSSSASSFIQVPPPLTDSSSLTEDLIENLTKQLALLTQSYRIFLPQTNNQLRTSSNARNQATVQDGRVVVQNVQGRPNRGQGINPRGGSAAGYGGAHNRVRNVNQGQARPGQERHVKCYNCNDPVTDKAGPSYDSDILSEVQDHDQYQDAACTHHEGHVMHDSVQLDHVVDSYADYTTDSNMIPYDQYVQDNEVPVVHSDVSSVPNDAFMMIYDDMCKPNDQSVSYPSRNTAVKNSLTVALATYKEQVELYERRAKFELTEREQKINEQSRIVISNCNFKEETLKKELHSIKLQLTSTINHKKSMVEEVTFLKKDFKQKENKYLEDFLDMKSLKEKVKDRLIKQDQSLQIVHMLYNHTPAIVHNAEDTLEIAEITRKKMIAKMNDHDCVTHKVKIAPHDYSKENFLATFTPQKQLSLEQIFWSNDLMNLKSKALKERTKVSRPIKALTVYHLNTPAMLVPRVLPTKSQVKIHIFTLIQLFSEFDKTCKMRITPTGLTEGEMGFEQTKACYLKEVAQYAVDRKHDAIEPKNVLIANDNLIAECLSKEVFSVATNSELNVAQFTEMTVAHTAVAARKDNVIRQLRKQLSQLQLTRSDIDRTLQVQTADSQITKLTEQVTDLQAQNSLFEAKNDKIKQHYKELYDSIKITCAKHLDQVTKLTAENMNLKTSVSKDKVNPQLSARDKHAIDVEPSVPRLRNNRDAHLDYLRHLKDSVETIHDIIEDAKVIRPLDRSLVSACRYTKYSHELLEYAIGTCPQGFQQRAKQLAHIPLIRKKQVIVAKPSDKLDRVNGCPNASRSQPKSNVKPNRISPAKGVNKLPVEDQPRTNKSHLKTSNRVDSSRRLKHTVINSNSDSICHKCLTSSNHDLCMATCLQSVVATPFNRHNYNVERKVKQVWKPKQVRQVWQPIV
nr:hypothetical protein [Tanacetum cinerariifolium]